MMEIIDFRVFATRLCDARMDSAVIQTNSFLCSGEDMDAFLS